MCRRYAALLLIVEVEGILFALILNDFFKRATKGYRDGGYNRRVNGGRIQITAITYAVHVHAHVSAAGPLLFNRIE